MGRPQLIDRPLGEFVVRQQLGEGGSAVVFRGEQPALGREVVIKILRSGRRVPAEAVQRFLREARLACRLDHPFAAHVYACGAEDDGVLWIAMEMVRGTPLDRILDEQGPMALARFAPLLERLCEVVAAAHEQGIVHRDIKPANVMVIARSGRLLPKLLDFGIAKLAALPAEPAAPRAGTDADADAEPPAGAPTGALTVEGASIGSPLYMAPEQWLSPNVDGRADIYALGVLAYQALTGVNPFAGSSLHEIAEAHATRPLPPLPPGLPPALHAVLARAVAKQAGDRFASALELAAELRAAAGMGEPAELPELNPALRDAAARSPQPLAEAIGALEAARNLHQARAALFDAGRALAAWTGVLALAARLRVGTDLPARLGTLLRRAHLDDDDWLALATELTAPFVDRAEAHPLPELVALLADAGPAGLRAQLGGLIALGRDDHGASADERHAAEVLERGRPLLAGAMAALAPLLAYDLVVADGTGGAERWTGPRRSPRPRARLRATGIAAATPLLVDLEGAPVLVLAPLAQVAAPAPGVADELFLHAGRKGAAARAIAHPSGFERTDEAAWETLRASLAGLVDDDPAAAAIERPPWRGLASFTAEDASMFVGREREVEDFCNRLRIQPLLVVVGPSGAGKSSFIHAGVAPALGDGSRTVSLRPGRTPMAALTARLGPLPSAHPERRATEGRAESKERVLLVVDQLEELFTLCAEPAEREEFAAALVAAARSIDDPVRVVVCLRDDFLVRAQGLAPLRNLLSTSLHLLATPARDDLIRILTEPARRAGYELDEPDLAGRMVDEVADQPGALALLSFTAAELWELRDRQFKLLTRKACDALGGVAGALARHAEDTLLAMPADARAVCREAFRHLVTAEGTRAVLTRAELQELLGDRAPPVIEQLIGARLLVASEGDGGEERIEIIHETLIGAWPRLVTWRREDAEGARLRDQLRGAARQWEERGRPRGALWRDDALTELTLWRSRHAAALTRLEEEFAAASVAEAARGRRLRRVLVAAAFVALAGGALAIWAESRQSARERDRAEDARALAQQHAATSHRRMIDLHEEQGRQALVAGDPLRAAAYLVEALRQGGDGPTLRMLLGRAIARLDPPPLRLGHGERLLWLAWNRDGSRLVTTAVDGEVAIWDERGRRTATLVGHHDQVLHAEFSADGARVITGDATGEVRVWDAASGAVKLTLKAHAGSVRETHFDPGGGLISCGDGGLIILWTPAGERRTELRGHQDRVRTCRLLPGGDRLISSGADGTVRIWDLRGGGSRELARHDGGVNAIAISPDGAQVASSGGDGRIRVVATATGAPIADLRGHAAPVSDLVFAPDGRRLLSSSRDATARLWALPSGELERTLRGHADNVASVDWSRDGARLLTTSWDGTARIWETGGTTLATLYGHAALIPRGAFHPDGVRAATAGWDHAARLWPGRPGHTLEIRHPAAFRYAAFSSDGRRLLVRTRDQRFQVFDAASGRRLRDLDLGTEAFTWSADGTRLGRVIEDRAEIIDVGEAAAAPVALPAAPVAPRWIQLRADGRVAVIKGIDGSVRVWELPGGRLRSTLDHHGKTVNAEPSGDGRFIVSHMDRVAWVWDAATGKRLQETTPHDGHIYQLAICPEGNRFVTVSNDRTGRVWDLQRGTLIATLEGHTNVVLNAAFTPDCRLVATASADGTVKLWESGTGRLLDSLDVLVDGVSTVEVAPAGDRLVTLGYDGVLRVWSIAPERRTAAELTRWLACYVPFAVRDGHLQPAVPDPTPCLR